MAIHRDKISEIEIDQFRKDVSDGLQSRPKYLSSKYFYDEIGDQLFIQIMNLPEYYLTNSELEILQEQSSLIAEEVKKGKDELDVIELGAGDGTKTIYFLQALNVFAFNYKPIDISANSIDNLKEKYSIHGDWLKFDGVAGDYFEMLDNLNSSKPKLILFLGSNMGNMKDEVATEFVSNIAEQMNRGDFLLLGLDLKKSKEIIAPAYNDSKGVTSKFNLNLLNRMNKELGANFNLDQFEHAPRYDEEQGVAYSYLRSKVNQSVRIESLNLDCQFEENELIHTEISRKYNDAILNKILGSSALRIHEKYMDKKEYFTNYLLKKQ